MSNQAIYLFEIKSDYEFYCFLKAHLPSDYSIVAEPEKSYYSEWSFHYKIFHNNNLLSEYKGDFLDTEKGYLVNEAKRILDNVREKRC